jgi:hypothetical protein
MPGIQIRERVKRGRRSIFGFAEAGAGSIVILSGGKAGARDLTKACTAENVGGEIDAACTQIAKA